MANRYWVGGTNNWDSTVGTKWSDTSGGAGGSSIPGSLDDVFFNISSGAVTCTLTVTTTVKSLNFTGFSGTFSMNAALTIAGDFTLSSSMNILGSSGVVINNSAILTSNSKQLNLPLTLATIATARTWTLVGDWYVTNAILGNSDSSTNILNGDKLYVSGNLSQTGTNPSITGTSDIILNGTGFWSSAGGYSNNITINTSGTLTLSGANLFYRNGTLKYLSGTVSSVGTTLLIGGSTTKLDLNGIIIDKVRTSGNTQVTLNSNLNVNDFIIDGSTSNTYNGTSSINVYRNLSVTSTGGLLGTSNIVISGTSSQTWTHTSLGSIRNSLTINKPSGTLVISGTVYYATGTMSHISGDVTTTSSTLYILDYSPALDTNGMTWSNVTLAPSSMGSSTTRLLSNLRVSGLLLSSGTQVNFFTGNYDIICAGSLTCNQIIQSSVSTLKMFTGVGGGTWSCATNIFNCINTIIDPYGTLKISGTVYFSGNSSFIATLSRTNLNGGLVDTTGSTIVFGINNQNTRINTFGTSSISTSLISSVGINWNNVTFASIGTGANTLLSDVCVVNLITFGSAAINGFKIYANGSIYQVSSPYGSSQVVHQGTGTWSSLQTGTPLRGHQFSNSLLLGTSSNLTIGSNVSYGGGGTLASLNGAVLNPQEYTLFIWWGCTLDTRFVTWSNINISDNSNPTNIYLTSNLNLRGDLTFYGGRNTYIYGSIIYVGRNLTLAFPSVPLLNDNYVTGTTQIIMNGSGTFSSSFVEGRNDLRFRLPITFDAGTNSINITGNLNIDTATVSYVSGNVQSLTSSTLNLINNPKLNTAGMTWSNIRVNNTSVTCTLFSDLALYGTFSFLGGYTLTMNGSQSGIPLRVLIAGSLVSPSPFSSKWKGTAGVVMCGSGDINWYWTPSSNIYVAGSPGGLTTPSNSISPSYFEINTLGTIIIRQASIESSYIKYTSGTVSYLGQLCFTNGYSNLGTQSIDWSSPILGDSYLALMFGSTYPTTLLSNITTNDLLIGKSSLSGTLNGFSIFVNRDLRTDVTTGFLNGTTNIILQGTGTWSSSNPTSTQNVLSNPLIINSPYGTVGITSSVYYGGGTISYVAGTVSPSGSTLNIRSNTRMNTYGMTWSNISLATSASSTLTLQSDLYLNGLLNMPGALYTISGSGKVYAGGSFSYGNNSGLSYTGNEIIMNGSGIISATAGNTTRLTNNFTIDTLGTLTFSGTFSYSSGLVKYVKGNVNTSNSVLFLPSLGSGATTSFDTNGMTWSTLNIQGSSTHSVDLISDLNLSNDFLLTSGSSQFRFNSVKIGGSFRSTTSGNNVLFGSSTFVINGNGTWSSLNLTYYRVPVTFNTTGTFSVSGSIYYGIGPISYISGNILTSGSTLQVHRSTTFSTGGMTWSNVFFTDVGISGATMSLTSTLAMDGLFSVGYIYQFTYFRSVGGTQSIVVGGGWNTAYYSFPYFYVNLKLTGGIITGNNTGTFASNGRVSILDGYQIEIAGNVTFATSSVLYVWGDSTGRFNYTTGSITTTGSRVFLNSLIMNTNTMVWGNVFIVSVTPGGAQQTFYLDGDMNVGGLLELGNSGYSTIIDNLSTSKTINAAAGISINGNTTIRGTGTIRATGGVVTGTNSSVMRNNLILDGNVIFATGSTFKYNTGTVSYVSGNVSTTNTSLLLESATTLNTGGMSWSDVTISGSSQTFTLLSNFATRDFNISGSGTTTLNGSTVSIGRNLNNSVSTTVVGSSDLSFVGTGTWSQSASTTIRNNVAINTTGSVKLSGIINYNTGTFSYVSGTLNALGSTMSVNSSTNFDLKTAVLGGLSMNNSAAISINLLSNLNIGGSVYNFSPVLFLGSYPLTVFGGFNHAYYTFRGQSKLILKGGNVVSNSHLNMDVDIDGDVTFPSNFTFGSIGSNSFSNRLNYLSGNVITTNSSLNLLDQGGTVSINTNGITWSAVYANAPQVILESDFNMNTFTTTYIPRFSGNYTINSLNGVYLPNTPNWGIQRGTGNPKLRLLGGTWSGSSPININTELSGNVKINGLVTYQTGTLSYTSGVINVTGSTLSLHNASIDTGSVVWNDIIFGSPLSTSSSLNINNNTLKATNLSFYFNSLSGNSMTFAGNRGWTSSNLTAINLSPSVARTIYLQQGVTYSVSDIVTMTASSFASRINFRTTQTSGDRANFIVKNGATTSVVWTVPYRINSAGGKTIYSQFATIDSATINWTNVPLDANSFFILF